MPTQNLTIANGQTTSNSIDLGGGTLLGLYCPSTLNLTSVTFKTASTKTGTYKTVRELSTSATPSPYSVAVAADVYVPLEPAVFKGCRYVQIVGNATTTAERVFEASVEFV